MKLSKRYLNDLVIYLQKTYCLYFVEFRQTPDGRQVMILCNPNNEDWWIEIIIVNLFSFEILVVCTGNEDKDKIKWDIKDKKFKGYGKKYQGKWLRL